MASKTKSQQSHFLQCINCQSTFRQSQIYSCPKCGNLLNISYDYRALTTALHASLKKNAQLSVWRYSKILPVSAARAVTIGEGGTGLTKSTRLSLKLGIPNVYFKNEGQNPTGSFKDRGMTVAITRAVEIGARTVLCASTGNTSASMAAYAAKAGLRAVVLVPKGRIAKGKLLQAIVHGAKIVQVKGNFDKALRQARKISQKRTNLYLVNSLNPYRIEGQKTLAFEVWEQLGHRLPDFLFVPVGNAGNISAIWKGFKELQITRLTKGHPKMVGVQAAGAAPITAAFVKRHEFVDPLDNPRTVASAIRIGAPASWKKALAAVKESNGAMLAVSDDEIMRAQRLLANHEGIFAEPASAASLAGLMKANKIGLIDAQSAVCVITGHGLKDQKSASHWK